MKKVTETASNARPTGARHIDTSAPATTAMVLAAGRGERMMPLTRDQPKPLIEIAGRTLIDRVLDRLEEAGATKVVVNLHYLADILEAHLRARSQGPEIIFSEERDKRLETGGGIKQAMPLFDCDPVLVINSDAVWTEDGEPALTRITTAWDGARMDALLLVISKEKAVGYAGNGDFEIDRQGRLRLASATNKPRGAAPYVFTGIQMLSLAAVAGVADNIFSLNQVYAKAAAAGRLFGIVHQGRWAHVGSPDAIEPAARMLNSDPSRPR